MFCPEKYEELRRALTCVDADNVEDEEASDRSDEEGSSDDEDDEDANDSTLRGFIVDDDVDDDTHAPIVPSASRSKKYVEVEAKKKRKEHPELKKLSLRNDKMRARYLKRVRKEFKSSAKIDETMRLLADIQASDPTEKTLIFSSFTTLLDLLEVPLNRMKYKYQRYDGSMELDDRMNAVNKFMDKADEKIMLISMKAGNAGLNLHEASQVILLDPFWVCATF